MKTLASLPVGLMLACVMATGVGAQDLEALYTFESANPANGWFGYNCEGIGDVNNDGYEDIGVAATYEDVPGTVDAGRAYVFSGATGALLFSLTSPNSQAYGEYGWIADLGDVNGDSHDDFVVTAWREVVNGLAGAGRAYVYSGATGDTLYSLESPTPEVDGRFGTEAGGHGDVSGDGVPDVAVGAWREDVLLSDAGKVHVYSGATGAYVRTYVSPNPSQAGYFGKPVANAGDVNGDGWDDLIVGARQEDPGGVTNAGMAYVFSGATGDTLYSLWPPDIEPHGHFGRGASGAGDVNGDGYADVAVGAPQVDVGYVNDGRAYVFAGSTGTFLHTLDSPNPKASGNFGFATWGGEDYDGDGYADVVVGAPKEDGVTVASAGRAYVFSGATGQPAMDLVSPMEEVGGQFGIWVGEGADVNGDGRQDVVVGARKESGGTPDAGRVHVFSQILLGGSVSGGALVLDWSRWTGAAAFWVYGADNETYFVPGFSPGYQHRLATLSPLLQTWSSANGVGDPDHNWTYLVLAVDGTEQELCRSNCFAEQDFSFSTGP
jgi:hypothetical protein